MKIDNINSAFYPSKEITNPEFFVGRKDEIKDSIIALSDPGSFLSFYGLRGVGKSSVINQVKLLAEGDTVLSKRLKIERYLPAKGFKYLTIMTNCDSYTLTVTDLLKRILFGDNNNPSLLSFTKTGDRKLEYIKESFKAGGGANLMGVKLEAGTQEERSYSSYLSDDLIQQFKLVLGTIQKDNQDKSGILILIDEFDVLKDKTGFSSIIKTCSNEFVKFGVSGIANTLTELISDHSSIGRQLHSIQINKMQPEEMFGIIKRAEVHIRNEITFTTDASNAIINHAEGFPFFVHLLGKEALYEAFENSQKTIDLKTIQALRERICSGRLKTIYEDIYHSSVKSSPQRELILKLFAEDENNEIYSEKVYSDAKDLGVSNPSQLMRELTTPQDGSVGVLTKIREQYFRFTDPVFKVYARLRTWKFEN